MKPNEILHVTTAAEWDRWAVGDQYEPAAFEMDGFIHCCSAQQLAGVLQRYYAGRAGLLLLHIDSAGVSAPLRYEIATNNERFPHIYGPLNKSAVVQIETLP